MLPGAPDEVGVLLTETNLGVHPFLLAGIVTPYVEFGRKKTLGRGNRLMGENHFFFKVFWGVFLAPVFGREEMRPVKGAGEGGKTRERGIGERGFKKIRRGGTEERGD